MSKASKSDARAGRARLALYHLLLLGALFVFWHLMTSPLLVSEEFARTTAFFFGKPLTVLQKIWDWFASGKIYEHLLITLIETLLAFAIGTALGLGIGYGLCKGLLIYGFPLDPKVYFISRLPVEVRPFEFLLTGIVAVLICLAATIVPALNAAAIRPADGLRAQ